MIDTRFFGKDNVVHVEFYEDNNNECRWKLVAANNEIVCASSEGFFSKQGARNNFKLTLKLGQDIVNTNVLS